MRGNFPFAAAAALLLACATSAPSAAQTAVDLQLGLAVDASGSVDDTASTCRSAAMSRPSATPALQADPPLRTKPGDRRHHGAVDGTDDAGPGGGMERGRGRAESAAAFAAATLQRVPRQLFGGGTSISGAIDHAATLFPRSPFRAGRRVIDISGDGSNNRGRPVTLARDEAVTAGIGINGLPILALEPDLDRYYYDSVIGGPGAFVAPAQSYETFGDAILKKLITEIAANIPPAHDPASARKR